jgi:hypothetical protein
VKGLKGPLAHALKTELTEPDREFLRMYMARLPDEADEAGLADVKPDQEGAEQPM